LNQGDGDKAIIKEESDRARRRPEAPQVEIVLKCIDGSFFKATKTWPRVVGVALNILENSSIDQKILNYLIQTSI
jgi:hypothetical protein